MRSKWTVEDAGPYYSVSFKSLHSITARDPSRRAFLRLSSSNVVKDLEKRRLLEDDYTGGTEICQTLNETKYYDALILYNIKGT